MENKDKTSLYVIVSLVVLIVGTLIVLACVKSCNYSKEKERESWEKRRIEMENSDREYRIGVNMGNLYNRLCKETHTYVFNVSSPLQRYKLYDRTTVPVTSMNLEFLRVHVESGRRIMVEATPGVNMNGRLITALNRWWPVRKIVRENQYVYVYTDWVIVEFYSDGHGYDSYDCNVKMGDYAIYNSDIWELSDRTKENRQG